MDDADVTYYDILQVPASANLNEIKNAYQKMARRLHPDKMTSKKEAQSYEQTEDAFLTLQKAWECLRDPQLRKEYDAQLYQQEKGKTSRSIPLSPNEWEFVEDQETGDLGYIYACRCGEDLWLQKYKFENPKSTVFIHCEGCSLLYRITSSNSVE